MFLQVQNGTAHPYVSMRAAFRSVIKTEGIGALYIGLAPNLFGSALAWGTYFQVYNTMKRYSELQLFVIYHA